MRAGFGGKQYLRMIEKRVAKRRKANKVARAARKRGR